MEDSMAILHNTKKGRMMNSLEKFHTYRDTKNGNQINDHHTVVQNAFEHTSHWTLAVTILKDMDITTTTLYAPHSYSS
jgi:hypothetical protein